MARPLHRRLTAPTPPHARSHGPRAARDQALERLQNLAAAAQPLAALTPRICTVLVRVSIGRPAVMQPDPTCAHVLYAEPDLSSLDGRRLRAVCGQCLRPISFLVFTSPLVAQHVAQHTGDLVSPCIREPSVGNNPSE